MLFSNFYEFTFAKRRHFHFFSALVVTVGWETEGIKVWAPDMGWCRAGS